MKKLFTFLFTVLFGTLSVVYPVLAANTYSIDLESGSSQYLSITDASQTGLDLTSTDHTIEMWVRFEAQSNAYYTLVEKFDGGSNAGYRWLVAMTNQKIGFQVGNGSSNASLEGGSSITWTNEVWYHLAVQYDESAGTFTVWRAVQDGSHSKIVDAVSTGITGGSGNNSNTFFVGYWGAVSLYPFDGEMDEVRVWNDLRTETELNDNFETEIIGTEAGLVSYWKLNNDLTDENSNGNDLTNNNSATFNTDVPFSGATPAIIPKRATIIIFE